jgi:hypothetical protein
MTPARGKENPKRSRRHEHGYRLRVESITYLGDDAAAARAIENFLRLSRSRDEQPKTEADKSPNQDLLEDAP